MYTRANTYPDAPGHWTTDDGEYEFVKTGNTWTARRRDSNRIIGSGPTLAAVMSLAGRHYMTPVGQWSYAIDGLAADGAPMRYGRGGWKRVQPPHDPARCAQCAEDEYRMSDPTHPPRNAQSWVLNAEHSIRTWLDTNDPDIFPDAWYIASCTCGWHAASQNAGLRNWNADGHAKDVTGRAVTLPGDKGPYL